MTVTVERLVRDGYRVYPAQGKRPLAAGWQAYKYNPATWPEGADVGILTGLGLLVVDVDGSTLLHTSLHQLLQNTECAYYRTSRGAHYYFRAELTELPRKVLEGVDFQWEGRGVIAPPSCGRVWARYLPFSELPLIPAWLFALCRLKVSLPQELYAHPLPQAPGEGRNHFVHRYLIKYTAERSPHFDELEQEAELVNSLFPDPLVFIEKFRSSTQKLDVSESALRRLLLFTHQLRSCQSSRSAPKRGPSSF